jgi:hypothetical protein
MTQKEHNRAHDASRDPACFATARPALDAGAPTPDTQTCTRINKDSRDRLKMAFIDEETKRKVLHQTAGRDCRPRTETEIQTPNPLTSRPGTAKPAINI